MVGQLASGDEVCVCVATGAMRKLRFPANFSDHKRAPGSRLRALRARGLGQLRSSASGSHVLVTRCVWWLPDLEITLSQPRAPRGRPLGLASPSRGCRLARPERVVQHLRLALLSAAVGSLTSMPRAPS